MWIYEVVCLSSCLHACSSCGDSGHSTPGTCHRPLTPCHRVAIQEKKVSVSIISKFIIQIMVLCRACKCEVDYGQQPPESPVSHLQSSMLDDESYYTAHESWSTY